MRPFKSLDFDCTTVDFDQEVSVVLPLTGGTPTYWKLTANFGLKVTHTGTFIPDDKPTGRKGARAEGKQGGKPSQGEPGETEYGIYTFKVKRGYFIGFAHFGLFVEGNRRPIGAAHVRVKTIRFPEDETSRTSFSTASTDSD